MYFTRALSLAFLAAAVVSCSSSSTPSAPTVDKFSLPDTVTVSSQGSYDIAGTVSFHDSENVTGYLLHFDVPAAVVPDQHATIDATSNATDLAVAFSLPSTLKKGQIVVLLTLYGASGVSSDAAEGNVTLQ